MTVVLHTGQVCQKPDKNTSCSGDTWDQLMTGVVDTQDKFMTRIVDISHKWQYSVK